MKKTSPFLLLACIAIVSALSSCIPMYELQTKCSLPTQDFIFKTENLLRNEGFEIKKSNQERGQLLAEMYVATGAAYEIRKWNIDMYDGNITATASLTSSDGGFKLTGDGLARDERTRYLNDSTSKEIVWYWKIRDEIANSCGNPIEFIERSKLQ